MEIDTLKNKPQSVKVCVRIRPPFQSEQPAQWKLLKEQNSIKLNEPVDQKQFGEDPLLKFMQANSTQAQKRQFGQLKSDSTIDGQKTSKSTFSFDKIYDQEANNLDVYQDSCQSIIERVTQGYNGTVFAYGQTTAGKTHTMIGTKSEMGMLQYAMLDIFKFIELEKEERDIRVWASYMEIYNETVNDLLDFNNTNLKIKEDAAEGPYVAGLKVFRLFSKEDVSKFLTLGEKSRHYRQTDIHEKSSRSHTIFRVLIENRLKDSKRLIKSENEGEEAIHLSYGTKYSQLNLVDLAGSERISESGSSSLEETSHINKSLFVLANVIYKLSDPKSTHIPYRDSKITQILKTSLGGNSLTSIICNISPNSDHISLTFSTLRFATRAKAIENKPHMNELIDDHELLQAQKSKIFALERKVAQLEDQLAQKELEQKKQEKNENLKLQLEQAQQKIKLYELRLNDLQFEQENVRIDHESLKSNYTKEKQTADIYFKLYNNSQIEVEKHEIETQTDYQQDQSKIFLELMQKVQAESNFQGQVSQNTMMELFYEYLEFENMIKNKLHNLPTRSRRQVKERKQSEQEKSIQSSQFDFYPERPDTQGSQFSQLSIQQMPQQRKGSEVIQDRNQNRIIEQDRQLHTPKPNRDQIKKEIQQLAQDQKLQIAQSGKTPVILDKKAKIQPLYEQNLDQNTRNKKQSQPIRGQGSILENDDLQSVLSGKQYQDSFSKTDMNFQTQPYKGNNARQLIQNKQQSFKVENQSIKSVKGGERKKSEVQVKSYRVAGRPNLITQQKSQQSMRKGSDMSSQKNLKEQQNSYLPIKDKGIVQQIQNFPVKNVVELSKTSQEQYFSQQAPLKQEQVLQKEENTSEELKVQNLPIIQKISHQKAIDQEEEVKVPQKHSPEWKEQQQQYNQATPQPLSKDPIQAQKNKPHLKQKPRKFDDEDFEDLNYAIGNLNKGNDQLNLTLDELEEEKEDFDFYMDDEMEDLLSGSIPSTPNTQSVISIPTDMIAKFNIHKKQKELLDEDLQQQVRDAKPKRGVNTYFMGDNRFGKCGTGGGEQFVENPKALYAQFKEICCGHHHNMALDHERVLYSWGKNRFGQLGKGEEDEEDNNYSNLVPNLVKGPLFQVKIDSLSCGWQHSMALTRNGFLFTWGLNLSGQLGLGDYIDRFEPTHVRSLSEHKITQISAGYLHSGCVTNTGSLFLWGANPDCRLMRKIEYYKKSGRPKNFSLPQLFQDYEVNQVQQVSCGTNHTLIIDEQGHAHSAGSSEDGQLGVKPYQFLPKKVKRPLVRLDVFQKTNPGKKVIAADGFSVFLDSDGIVYTCGKGNFGRLGNGGQTGLDYPTRVKWFDDKRILIKDVVAGGRHCIAISNESPPQLYGWGFGFYHQFGLGEDKEDHLEPVKLKNPSGEGEKKIKRVACGYFHTGVIVK